MAEQFKQAVNALAKVFPNEHVFVEIQRHPKDDGTPDYVTGVSGDRGRYKTLAAAMRHFIPDWQENG